MTAIFRISALVLLVTCLQLVQGLFPATVPKKQKHCCPKNYCFARDDPHMQTFDGRRYEIQHYLNARGEYVLYLHDTLPYQVNVLFHQAYWNHRILNVCGVVVRCGCTTFRYIFNSKNCQELLEKGQVHSGPEVIGSNDGCLVVDGRLSWRGEYTITLPTGTKVVARPGRVFIYASTEDYNQVRGLCGTFTDNCEDDFLTSDGTYNPHPLAHTCTPYAWSSDHFQQFSESWRVKTVERSLFHLTDPSSVFDCCKDTCVDTIFYCACYLRELQGQLQPFFWYRYQYSGSLVEAATHQRLCLKCEHDITDELFTGLPSPMKISLDLAKEKPSDVERPFPNDLPEKDAENHCKANIEEVEAVKDCQQFGITAQMIDADVKECMDDIRASGGTLYTAEKRHDLLQICKNNMNETDIKLREDLFKVLECGGSCRTGLDCVDGRCVCPEGERCVAEIEPVERPAPSGRLPAR